MAVHIGSEIEGLSGVHNDVAIMAELMARRGFETRRLTGADATRDGILEAYDRLIGEARPGDAIVVTYSGHGVMIAPAEADAADIARLLGTTGPPPELQAIVPTDFGAAGSDFRGITALELSVLQNRLTAVTRNVTVILDCCHAARMSRDPDLVPKALQRVAYLDVAAHFDALRRAGRIGPGDLRPLSNPDAVRIVACAPFESSYEGTNADGLRCGMMTDALRIAFHQAGDLPVTWETLMRAVRARVAAVLLGQRPEVEGPGARVPFEERQLDRSRVLPILSRGGLRVSIPGGRLVGVEPGDQFAAMPAGAGQPEESTAIGRITVASVGSVAAEGAIAFAAGHAEVPLGTEAHPTLVTGRRWPVVVAGSGADADRVAAAVDAAPQLRVSTDPADTVLATVEVGATMVVRDHTGPLTGPRPAGPAGIDRVVTDLLRLSRAATLRGLEPEPAEALDAPFTIEWGRVVDGTRRPLPVRGELLHAGEQIYVLLRNDGPGHLYFSLFDIGVLGKVTLLLGDSPSGRRLGPGDELTVGADELGTLTGLTLGWPDGAPGTDPRGEDLLVIVTKAPQDLSVLQQDGIQRGDDVAGGSTLQQLVAQIATGALRDLTAVAAPATVRFAVWHASLLLDPALAPAAETVPFLIDDRPDPSVLQLSPRGTPRRQPATVAIRLNELVVHRNKALGSTDVRVDAIVLTGPAGNRAVYRAETARFTGIGDETRLPMDNLLVYHGEVVNFVDLAVIISRDRKNSLDLSAMLADELNGADFQQAAGVLIGAAVAAPHAAVAAAMIGAGAVAVNTAYKLLSKAVGNSIGLYRTSLLAGENFGIGRHPADGLRRVQDYSFAYEIVPV
ncbi:caspase family protein [Actinoplanes sp. NPDC026619]|uniref:caspase family protein n=1 Tax=Actinoplanes sp. NPDC026619 TaxID=3155798 RepID=UPI0034113736